MVARLLGFPDYRDPASRLAQEAGLGYAEVDLHRFPDGESRLRLPVELPRELVICRSLHFPNDKLVELALTALAARERGVERLILVAPYLCYMRQDKEFTPGEVVSQRHVGALLAQWFDGLVTVDPHLHRISSLQEAVPLPLALALSATGPMGDYIATRREQPVLVGPDAESEQWVAAIARSHGFDWLVGAKRRLGDREVCITLPDFDFAGRAVVLVDDVASTGHTLAEAARLIRAQRPASLDVAVTHALFAGDAEARLREAGIDGIWSSDSIPHPSNAFTLAPLLAPALEPA